MLEWNSEEVLGPVQDAAEEVLKTFKLFTAGNYEIFSHSLTPFEEVQQAVAALSNAIRNARYKVQDHIAELRTWKDEKNSALANLRKNIKDYPRGLLQFKERLANELEKQAGCAVRIDILADVLELADERWRGAVEGYLNAQKFYLLVDPAYYQDALSIFDRIKNEFGPSFGLVDIGKLREREKMSPWDDSLAKKVETENMLARSYIDYLLGRVVCCNTAAQLRKHRTAITADGMLYQGYVARVIRRELMDDAFIGRRAVSLRISRLQEELAQIEAELRHWAPILQLLSKQKEMCIRDRYRSDALPGGRAFFVYRYGGDILWLSVIKSSGSCSSTRI